MCYYFDIYQRQRPFNEHHCHRSFSSLVNFGIQQPTTVVLFGVRVNSTLFKQSPNRFVFYIKIRSLSNVWISILTEKNKCSSVQSSLLLCVHAASQHCIYIRNYNFTNAYDYMLACCLDARIMTRERNLFRRTAQRAEHFFLIFILNT